MSSANKECVIDECDRSVQARGWCHLHYQRWRKHGDPLANLNPVRPAGLSLADAFATFATSTAGDCTIWEASRISTGYGQMRWKGQPVLAHRVAYEIANGPIPEGMYIDHTCWVRACVNPAHLRLVTPKQNQENREGAQRNSTSGLLGVHWQSRNSRWRAAVQHNGRRLWLGEYLDPAEAEKVAIEGRLGVFTHNNADRAVTA
ncbi:MAG: HNH endonuclease [Rhodococcus qingshengii]